MKNKFENAILSINTNFPHYDYKLRKYLGNIPMYRLNKYIENNLHIYSEMKVVFKNVFGITLEPKEKISGE